MERDRLRAAVALAGVVPGARLALCVDGSAPVMVSTSGGDISSGQLRRALLAEEACDDVDCSRFINDASLCGSLVELGGGLALVCGDGDPQRVFTTLLGPSAVAALVDEVVTTTSITVTVTADFDLGVTVVGLEKERDARCDLLQAFALKLAARCLVGEIERGLCGRVHRGS